MATLESRDLHVSVSTEDGPQEILRGVDLTVTSGQTHAIMGPNGSGKSTLAYSLAGHPKYQVTSGTVRLDGEDVLAMTVDARAAPACSWPCSTPSRSPGSRPPTSSAPRRPRFAGKHRRSAMGQGGQDRDDRPGDRPDLRRPQRQRGLLRWREAQEILQMSLLARRSPSWTRPTRASTSTRCGSCPRVSTATSRSPRVR